MVEASRNMPGTAADFCKAVADGWSAETAPTPWPDDIVSYLDTLRDFAEMLRDYPTELMLRDDTNLATEVSKIIDDAPSGFGALALASTTYAEMAAMVGLSELSPHNLHVRGKRFLAETRSEFARKGLDAIQEATDARTLAAAGKLSKMLERNWTTRKAQEEFIALARRDPHALAHALDGRAPLGGVEQLLKKIFEPMQEGDVERTHPVPAILQTGDSWRLALRLFELGVIEKAAISEHLPKSEQRLLSALRPNDLRTVDIMPKVEQREIAPREPGNWLERTFLTLTNTAF
jgi:hypothetical protein